MGRSICTGLCIEDKTLFHLTTMKGELLRGKNALSSFLSRLKRNQFSNRL